MYARIGLYQVKPGTLDASLERARADLLPRIWELPGLHRYVGVLIGPDALASVSVWETREQADATETLSGWEKDLIGPTVVTMEHHVGEIILLHGLLSPDALPTIGVVRVSTSKPGAADQREKVRAEFVPLLDQQPGFNSFAAMRTDEGQILSYISFDTMEDAGKALTHLIPWLDQNLAPTLSSSQDYVGAITWAMRR